MNKFKIGDYVQSINWGYVVLVDEFDRTSFSGTVVEGNNPIFKVGESYNSWGVEFFKKINYQKNKECKEGKTENRIVRKLEDLRNMGNGIGLYIDSNLDVRLKDKKMLICCGSDLVNTNLGVYLEVLKAMGFKFEYKPLRTVEEVLEEMKNNSKKFEKEGENFCIALDHDLKRYVAENYIYFEVLGGVYLTKNDAQKYVNELNEIIGDGK
ncbi:MAG: hypothetical protein RSB50_06330 [Cetobacterium sp.]